MNLNKICGIYHIRNKSDGKIYIGSSVNIGSRWGHHKYHLRAGEHHCAHLQSAWNKYGEDQFEIIVAEICSNGISAKQLLAIEQVHLDNSAIKSRYNSSSVAGVPCNYSRVVGQAIGKIAIKNHPQSLLKPLERVNPDTGEVKEYLCASDAEAEGFLPTGTLACCHGKRSSYANYYWQFLDGSTPEDVCSNNDVFIAISGSRNDGTILKIDSLEECAALGFDYNTIKTCCSARDNSTYKDYKWSFVNNHGDEVAALWKRGTYDSQSRPIERIDPITGEVKEYNRINDAVREGFGQSNIYKCCNGIVDKHKGYHWRYLDKEAKEYVSKLVKVCISQIDKSGNTVKVYRTQEEVRSAGYSYPAVWLCCQLKHGRKTLKGFIWAFGDWTGKSFDVKSILNNKFQAFKKAVIRKDPVTLEEVRYASQADAVKDGFIQAKISQCCLGSRKTHGGYLWRFADS